MVVVTKNILSQDIKTTFKHNLTCTFLSVRLNLKNPLCHGGPCTICKLFTKLADRGFHNEMIVLTLHYLT